jgi:hypothetical protein
MVSSGRPGREDGPSGRAFQTQTSDEPWIEGAGSFNFHYNRRRAVTLKASGRVRRGWFFGAPGRVKQSCNRGLTVPGRGCVCILIT